MSNVEDAKQPAVRNLESWKPYPWWFHGCQHHRHREPFAHDFDEVEVGPVEGLIYHGIPFRNFSPRSQNVCVFLFIQMRENQKVWVWLRKRIIVVAFWFPTYSDIYEYNGNDTLQTVFVHGHRSNFCAQKVSRCFHMALS